MGAAPKPKPNVVPMRTLSDKEALAWLLRRGRIEARPRLIDGRRGSHTPADGTGGTTAGRMLPGVCIASRFQASTTKPAKPTKRQRIKCI